MVLYDYVCLQCERPIERLVKFDERDEQVCKVCGLKLVRQMPAPMGRMKGQYGKGGGMDRFTADMLGTTLADLPPELKVDAKP